MDQVTYIMERAVRSFDISTPIGALCFAQFLIRLRARDQVVNELFAGRANGLYQRLASGDYTNWAMPPREKDPESDQTKQPAKRAETLGQIVEEPESVQPGDNAALKHGSNAENNEAGKEDVREQKTGGKRAGSKTHKTGEGKKLVPKKAGSVASSDGKSDRGARGSSWK